MRRIPILVLLALSTVVAVALSACGAPTKQLTQSAATGLATTGTMANTLVAGMMQPGSFMPASVGTLSAMGLQSLAPQSAGCGGAWSNTTDVDNDGVYADATATFSCSGTGFTVSGTMHVHDNNDGDATSGYTVTVTNLTISSGGTTLVENLTWDLTKTGTYSYALTFDLKLQYTDSSGTLVFEDKGSPTYTADPPIAGITYLGPFAAGTFTFDGSVSYQDANGLYQLTRKSGQGGVHYDSTCTTVFDSGNITYKDTSGNTAVISFPTCGTVHLTYNGTLLY